VLEESFKRVASIVALGVEAGAVLVIAIGGAIAGMRTFLTCFLERDIERCRQEESHG
jgi:uncharacterized membrane protein